jgi:hypothetical protein
MMGIYGEKIRFFSKGVTLCLILLAFCACGSRNSNKVTYKKLPKFPMVIGVGEEVPLAIQDAMIGAAQEWNDAAELELIKIELNSKINTRFKVLYEEPESIAASSDSEPTNRTFRVIARTERYLSKSDRILYGKILISPSAVCLRCVIDRKYIILHEFGHLMGLKHTEERDSVMRDYYPHFKGTFARTELNWPLSRPNYDLRNDVKALKKLHAL